MSSVVSSPGRKVTSAVYFVFGVSFGLFLIRYLFSDLFGDIRAVVALGSLMASIIGTLLYYLHPEQRVENSIVNSVYDHHGGKMERFIVMKRLVYQVWKVALDERWETPQEEAKASLRAVVKGGDLQEEVWKRKGAYYFVIGALFLFLSVPIDPFVSLIMAMILGVVIIFSFYLGDEDFESICMGVALFRFLEETHSMTKNRNPTKHYYIRGSNVPVIDVFDPILSDLNTILLQRDWIRFQRRFIMIKEELETFTKRAQPDFHDHVIESLFSIHTARYEVYRKESELQTRTVCKVLLEFGPDAITTSIVSKIEELINDPNSLLSTVSQLNLISNHDQSCLQLLNILIDDYPEMVNKITLNIVRRWYVEQNPRFKDKLVKCTAIVNDDKETIATLEVVLDSDSSFWSSINPHMVRVLTTMKGPKVLDAQVEVLRTRKSELVATMIEHANIKEPRIAREMILISDHAGIRESIKSLFRTIIEGGQRVFDKVIPPLVVDVDQNVRVMTLMLLNEIVRERIKERFRERLLDAIWRCSNDSIAQVRKITIDLAVSIGGTKVNSLLYGMAQHDDDEEVREYAGQYLPDEKKQIDE